MDVDVQMTAESLQRAKEAQARERAAFEAETGERLASDGSVILEMWIQDALAAIGLVLIVLAFFVCF